MLSSGTSSARRQRGRGERVVDVVEAGQRERDLGLAGGRAQREAGRAHAFQAHVAGCDRRRRPRLAAARAVVVAEVAEVDRVEHVRRAAAAAVLGVGRVGHPGQRQRVVLDPEVQRARVLAAEVRDQRVVGVQHEPRAARAQHLLPALGDRLELAVAVELVAEQVAEQDRARVQLRGERGQPQLVDLEQPELAVDRRRPDARRRAASWRSRRPCSRPPGCARARPRRARRCRRPSRRSSSCRWSPRSSTLPRCRRAPSAPIASRREAHQHLARRARRAAAAQARERADGARERELRGERVRHQVPCGTRGEDADGAPRRPARAREGGGGAAKADLRARASAS